MSKIMVADIFSDKELDTLLESAIQGNATDEECQRLVKWAEMTRINIVILNEVLKGKSIISIKPDGFPKLIHNNTE